MEPYQRAIGQLRIELPYSHHLIRLELREGQAILEGDVEWPYQKDRAEAAVRRAGVVTGVRNLLRVRPAVDPREIWRRVEDGFRRRAA